MYYIKLMNITVFYKQDFLTNNGKWLHVDMAYPATSGERATGYGVALLFELVKKISA